MRRAALRDEFLAAPCKFGRDDGGHCRRVRRAGALRRLASIDGKQIGEELLHSIGNSPATLMKQHGVFTLGPTVQKALKAAVMVEDVAQRSRARLMLCGNGNTAQTQEPSPFLLITGVMSALMVLGTIFLLPQLGAGKLFLLQIVGQIIMALIVSHFGLFESAQDPITPQKIIGAAFLVVGAIITVVRF